MHTTIVWYYTLSLASEELVRLWLVRTTYMQCSTICMTIFSLE